LDTTAPVRGTVFLITDCAYPFAVSLKIAEFIYKNPITGLSAAQAGQSLSDNRILQLDDGDYDDE
jgi:hypothetical protein